MSMIRRGKSGEGITSWTKEEDDMPLLCRSCHRVIPSRSDLLEKDICPFCEKNAKQTTDSAIV